MAKAIKILQINASYKPAYIYGGPTMSVAKLSEQLVKAGCAVEVFTTTANGTAELQVIKNIKVNIDGVDVTYFSRLTKDHTHFSPPLLRKLWQRASGFDVIHIHAWWNFVSVFSALIAYIKKVPVVISPRGTLSSYSFINKNNIVKKWMHSLLGKRLLNNSFTHTTSIAESNALPAIVNPKGNFVIANFVHIPALATALPPINNNVFRIIFLSRIEQKKGLDILLEALPAINIPYHLTIAGDGDKQYIEQLKKTTRLNLTEANIDWIGFQNESKFDILREHHLLVLPSYNENFGNVIIESLSVGTAVLISEHVGLADYVLKNNFGWICQTNPKSVSDSINNIAATHPGQLLNIRESASAIIRKDFNEHRLVQKYIDMYRQIITND